MDLQAPPSKPSNAPIGNDGNPVELHHPEQDPNAQVEETTRTDHRGGDNDANNHTNTEQDPSKIDRKEFAKQRRGYWTAEWDSGRCDDFDAE